MMRAPASLIVVTVGMLLSLIAGAPVTLDGQGAAPVALSGVVSSSEEGRMEGVVVTARRTGATFTLSVVSNAAGVYTLPRTHLESGTYDVTVRAVGYDLASSGRVEVSANAPAALDLKLRKTADLASQLSSLEWLTSM